MGCDIHMYVESRKRSDTNLWRSFGSRFNPGRDYELFGYLAGVRGGTALIEPRGLPDDLAYYSQDDARLYISDDDTSEEGVCTLEQAQSWAKYGSKIHLGHDGKPTWVDHPDWHSHSWLNAEEFQAALDATSIVNYYNDDKTIAYAHGNCDDGYYAMLAAMLSLQLSGNESRVVFWFDN